MIAKAEEILRMLGRPLRYENIIVLKYQDQDSTIRTLQTTPVHKKMVKKLK